MESGIDTGPDDDLAEEDGDKGGLVRRVEAEFSLVELKKWVSQFWTRFCKNWSQYVFQISPLDCLATRSILVNVKLQRLKSEARMYKKK